MHLLYGFILEESGYWIGLSAVQIFHQLNTFDAQWNDKYDKGDPGLLNNENGTHSSPKGPDIH